MAKPLDLDAYLERINYTGPRTPTYDALTGILQAHIASIPFESFDVLLGRPIRLDPEGLQAKIVTARRGGYCFEHASLMYAALERIGFVTVTIGGAAYVIDPGFGPFACPVPIPIDGAPVPTSAPTHRLAREGNDWVLYVTREGEQIRGWVSTMEEE